MVALSSPVAPARADGERLRLNLKDEHADGADLWIYNDIEKTRAKARRQKKPLFVTFRCVPCKACAGFDAAVARGSRIIENLVREKFVSVHQVEMKGVDLTLFQFDYDLNWAAMFLNADGVVYARYGTQSAAGPDAYNSISGLEKTMRRVLKLHEVYPKNAGELDGKRGARKPYKTALEMPGLRDKEDYRRRTTRKNGIHCHNVHDAEQAQAQNAGTLTRLRPDLLWRHPLPENLGLTIDRDEGVRIATLRPGSPAQRVGLEAGESVTHVSDQAITSIADIQWALHHLPSGDALVKVRGSKTGVHALKVDAGWKRTDVSWRGSMGSLSPRLRVCAPALNEDKRRAHGIPEQQAAFLVKWINAETAGGRSARDAGLRHGDIVVELEGKHLQKMTPQQFQLHIKLRYKVGDELRLTVLRDGQRRPVIVRLVE